MYYGLLADLIVFIHALFIGYVLFGQLVILLGVACGWGWVRNVWFRLSHLLAIAFVAYESLFNIACPLTVWEDTLRMKAGQTIDGGTFIGRWMHYLIFYEAETWVFTAGYVIFALIVLVTFLLAPPRLRKSAAKQAALPANAT